MSTQDYGRSHLTYAEVYCSPGAAKTLTAVAYGTEAALSLNIATYGGVYNIGPGATAYTNHGTYGTCVLINAAGYYIVRAKMNVVQTTTAKLNKLAIWKNGAGLSPEVSESITALTNRYDTHLEVRTVLWLEPGDYIQAAFTSTDNDSTLDSAQLSVRSL